MSDTENTHRLLVIANETCPCPALLDEVAERAGRHGEHRILIVAPALNSRLRHYLSDTDEALAAARERLESAVDHLRKAGVDAHGVVGDADPFVAFNDASHEFEADEVLVSTHPPERSHWLERRLLERIGEITAAPVHHVISAYGVVAA